MQQSSNPYILILGGCGRLLHTLAVPSCVSTVFSTVSSLHPTSFLYLYTCMMHGVSPWFAAGVTRGR